MSQECARGMKTTDVSKMYNVYKVRDECSSSAAK